MIFPSTKSKTDYIKMILFLGIGLIFSTEIIQARLNDRRRSPDECLPYIQSMHDTNKSPYNLWYYAVDLTIDIESNTHHGQVKMDICVADSLILRINTDHLIITKMRWSTYPQFTSDLPDNITVYTFKKYDNYFIISFTDSAPSGLYTLVLNYKSESESNFFRSSFQDYNFRRLIITQSIRQLFPTWETKLKQKVPFDLSVRRNLDGYTVLSNAPLFENNSEWLQFETISIIPEELVIVLMPLEKPEYDTISIYPYFSSRSHQDDPLKIKSWTDCTTPTLSFAQSIINDVTERLHQYFRKSQNLLKTHHVVTRDAPLEMSEITRRGIIFYRDTEVTYRYSWGTEIISAKIRTMKTIISRVARQWIGGFITPKINDSWISQSFATFFQFYIFNQMLGERYEMFLLVDIFRFSFSLDTGGNDMWHSLLPISLVEVYNTHFKEITYQKGALLLRMLQHIMGKETFRRGVVELLFTFKYDFELITSDDLWSTMQTVLNAESKPKIDIRTVMDTYIRRKSYPVVVVTRNYETGETIIFQRPYDTFYMQHDVANMRNIESESNSSEWWIPVTWTTESYPIFQDTTILWLGPMNKTITIKTNPDDWIIINLQQIGYYRVHYDRTNWEKIGNFLNNEDYTKIHVLNRAQLIYDIGDLFQNGHINWALFTSVTSYLSREVDYIVWEAMLKCCLRHSHLDIYVRFPENRELLVHLASYFDGIFNKIGYEEKSDDDNITKLTREKLANEACRLGNPTCRNAARNKLEKYLTDPTPTHQISSQLEYWMFCYGLKNANITIWHQALRLLMEQKKSLCPLACTEDSNTIMKFIHMILKNSTSIEKFTLQFLIGCIARNWIDDKEVFSHFLHEFMTKKHLHEDTFSAVIDAVHTGDQFETMHNAIADIYMRTDTYSSDEYSEYTSKIEKYGQHLYEIWNKFQNAQQTKIF